MEKLSLERKGEIAWALTKRRLAESGIPLGGKLQREAGNMAQKLNISKKQAVLFIKEAFMELYNELFPDYPVKMGSNFPGDDSQDGLLKEARNEIALNYFNQLLDEKSSIVLNKERLPKEISNISKETGVKEEELLSLVRERLAYLFQEGIKMPND